MKKKIIDVVANIQIIPANPVLKNGSVLLCLQKSGIGSLHIVYVFDKRSETFRILQKGYSLEYFKHNNNYSDYLYKTEEEKIKIKSELFIKAVNSPARVVIKERMLISKKGQYKKISYVNLFETDVKSSDSNIIFADILEYCARSLNVKKLFWKNKNNGYFNLVLFMR